MEIIAENLHLMNLKFLQAIENRDKNSLIQLAKSEVDAGATALDVNMGQNRNLGRLTPWVVEQSNRLWKCRCSFPVMY